MSSASPTSRRPKSWTSSRSTPRQERAIAEVEYRADDICLAWLLEALLFDRGWEETFEGEITGVIASGVFARFGEVFEGYLPVRKLPGYFELNELGTALVARRGGRRYGLGDRIEVRVSDIDRPAGKVELFRLMHRPPAGDPLEAGVRHSLSVAADVVGPARHAEGGDQRASRVVD